MRGFPKYINSKDDVLNLVQEFPTELKTFLQDLYNHKDQWLIVSKLEESDVGVENETNKIVEVKDTETNEVKERYQYELKEDVNGTIFRLGFKTSEEVLDLINSL